MIGSQDQPEPDRSGNAPHPRETKRLIGQEAAEAVFLHAYSSGRLHHAWLVTGLKGVGKATLAWRIARFLLTEARDESGPFDGDALSVPQSLDVPSDHPVAQRAMALSEPRLFLLRRGYDDRGTLRRVVTVDETRKLKSFLSLSAADGGRRVVIVDSVDDMNVNAANALLKSLEEPPPRTTFLLVCHQPARLLPTIRSRCRELRCVPLAGATLAETIAATGVEAPSDSIALAELSGGSPGAALELVTLDGLTHYAEIVGLFADAPSLDRPRAIRLAGNARAGDPRSDLIVQLIENFVARSSAAGAGRSANAEAAPGEAAAMSRLSPDLAAARLWAELHEKLGAKARHALAVNLDPSALILDMVLTINETAAAIAAGRIRTV